MNIAYDGSEFAGWQRQRQQKTVQGSIEAALSQVLNTQTSIQGAGRTDTGVHALEQVAHFEAEAIPQDLAHRLNRMLGTQIAITEIKAVATEFHARFSAQWRSYRYEIAPINQPHRRHNAWLIAPVWPTEQTLNAVARQIEGIHDFAGFSKNTPNLEHSKCQVFESRWNVSSETLHYHIRANRFLRNMVRRLVAAQIQIAKGEKTLLDLRKSLLHPHKSLFYEAAPAQGLILMEVGYPTEIEKVLGASQL